MYIYEYTDMFRVRNRRSCKSRYRLVFLQLVSRKFYWRTLLVILENGVVCILYNVYMYLLCSNLISARAAAVVARSYNSRARVHKGTYDRTLHCTYVCIVHIIMLLNVWAHEEFSLQIVVTPPLWLCWTTG